MALVIPLLAHPLITFLDILRPALEVFGLAFMF